MSKLRVLIADDDAQFKRALVLAIAQTDDLEVIATSEDTKHTIESTRDSQPDIIVVSITVCQLDIAGIIKKIRAVCPKAAIIVVSSYAYGVYVLPSVRAGALGYFVRDSPINDLIGVIRSVGVGELVFDAKIVGKILRLVATEPSEERVNIEPLRPREIHVLRLIAKGKHNRDIARDLNISEHTVHSHLTNIFQKLMVSSRTGAVLYALKEGLLTFDDLP